MDIHSKTLHIFKGFIDDLIKVFPEYKEPLVENYSDILAMETMKINEVQKVRDFLNKIDSISTEITNREESIFENDLFLLKDICFKKIWISNITEKTKDTIWKYLQSFCLINININSNDKLSDALNDIENNNKVNKKVAKDLKNFKKINDDFTNKKNSDEDMDGFNNILENTSIGKIAKEITEELNLGDNSSEADMKELFNPENMMKIFSSINSKISGNDGLNKEDLASEATNICSTMKDNPLFSQLMGMQSSMFGNMQDTAGPGPGPEPVPNTKSINVGPNKESNRNSDARKNARRKLDNKKKVKVNKTD